MTPQLKQVVHWMDDHHRIARCSPVSQLFVGERLDNIQQLTTCLRELAIVLGVEVGHPKVVAKEDDIVYPAASLAALTKLEVNLYATYHTLGLADVHDLGITEHVNQSLPRSAAPGPHTPNFSSVLARIYTSKSSHDFS